MSDHTDRHDLNDVEALLRSFRPASPNVDRDELHFQAGRASQQPRVWKVGAVTGVLGILLGVVGCYAFLIPKPPPPKVVYVPGKRNSPPPTLQPPKKSEPESPAQPSPSVTSEPESDFRLPPIPIMLFFGVPSPPNNDYVQLRDHAVRFGVDALPPPSSNLGQSADPPQSLKELRKSLLEEMDSY